MKTKTKKLIPLPRLLEKAQRVFNAWIRERDKDCGCITCNHGRVEHACHFYSAGHYSALRFNENNVHGGCLQCNYFKHGSGVDYRRRIENKIGLQKLQLLDSVATRNPVKKYTRFELEQIILKYSL
jgi:hypothetical protein